MKNIIGENNKVNYGCFDEPINWNYKDFRLFNIFDKEIKGLHKIWAYHQFNYIGIVNKEYAIGIATVDLSLGYNIFAFVYQFGKGYFFKTNDIHFIRKGAFQFDRDPENYILEYKTKKNHLLIMHSKEKEKLEIHCNFDSKLILNGTLPFSLEQKPLRVLNPSLPMRWTYTEKMTPLFFSDLDCCINGKPINLSKKDTVLLYDWSGGYLRRNTNWFWCILGGETEKKLPFGANFAALVNESYYPENAFWIDGERERVSHVIFDFNYLNPLEPWHIFTENKIIDLIFRPDDVYSRKVSAGPVLKTNFQQYIGSFSGTIKKGRTHHTLKGIKGFSEIQKARW